MRIDATAALRSLSVAGDSAVRRQLHMCVGSARRRTHVRLTLSECTLSTPYESPSPARARLLHAPARMRGGSRLRRRDPSFSRPVWSRGRYTRVQILGAEN